MLTKKHWIIMLLCWLVPALASTAFATQAPGFTQEDRERLIRLETTLQVFMEQTNKRFEELRGDINARFAQSDRRMEELRADMNARFAQSNQRMDELRMDMNTRFGQSDRRMEELRADMNARFEQMDRRFEQSDKRFEDMMSFLWMLVAVFTAMTVATIGFAYWDRRTMIRKAREETIAIIEKDGRLSTLIHALRGLAAENPKLAAQLRTFGLL